MPEPEATLAVEFSEVWMEPGPLSGRTSLVTGPSGKIPPYTPAALERLADGLRQPLTQRADSHDDRGYSERCLRFVTGGPPDDGVRVRAGPPDLPDPGPCRVLA